MIAGKLEIEVVATVNKSQLSKEIEKARKQIEKLMSGSVGVGVGVGDIGGGGKGGGSAANNQFSKSLKLFKFDLFWRWIKGTWSTITKFVPLIGKLGEIFGAIIGLVLTALFLPFLPGILKALTWLLDKSVAFFDYMQSLGNLSPSEFAKQIVTDINKFFKENDWEKIGKDIGKSISDFLTTISGSDIGKTVANGFNAAVKFITGMFDGIDWKSFGTSIGDAIYTALTTFDWLGFGWMIWNGIKAAFGFSMGLQESVGKNVGSGILNNLTPIGLFTKLFESTQHLSNGGRVLGIGNMDSVPTMLTPGETVTPKGQSPGTNLNISINGIVDERKFKEIVQSVVGQALNKTYNVRGANY